MKQRIVIMAAMLLAGSWCWGQMKSPDQFGGARLTGKEIWTLGLVTRDQPNVGDCFQVNADFQLKEIDCPPNATLYIRPGCDDPECSTNRSFQKGANFIGDLCPMEGGTNPRTPLAEPIDVPAITEGRQECVQIPNCNICAVDTRTSGNSCGCCSENQTVQEPTCVDKSRILQTAENGKHWCHKPQL
jgi:hypothetical protein